MENRLVEGPLSLDNYGLPINVDKRYLYLMDSQLWTAYVNWMDDRTSVTQEFFEKKVEELNMLNGYERYFIEYKKDGTIGGIGQRST